MACRCAERGQQLRRAVSSLTRGDVKTAARDVAAAGKSLAQDVRSGDLRKAGMQRLAQMRGVKR